MKAKLLNILLIVCSLFGFLEWGGGNSAFLFQAEVEVFSKLFTNPMEALHPLTILPLLGQLLLVITLFQKQPNKTLTYIGMWSIGALLLLMFFIGCMSLNFKIILSTLPFITMVFFTIREYRQQKLKNS